MATAILQGLGSFGADVGTGADELAKTRREEARAELERMEARLRLQAVGQQIEEQKRKMEWETPGGMRQYAEQILKRPLTDQEAQIIAKVSPYYYSRNSGLASLYYGLKVDENGIAWGINRLTNKYEKVPSQVLAQELSGTGLPMAQETSGQPPAGALPQSTAPSTGAPSPGAIPAQPAPSASAGPKFPVRNPSPGPMLQQVIWGQLGKPPDPAQFGGEQDPRYVQARVAWGKAAEKMMKDIASSGAFARGMAYQMFRTIETLDPETAMVSLNWAKDVVGKGYASATTGTKLLGRNTAVDEMKSGSASLRQAITDLQPGDAFDLMSTATLYMVVHAPMLGMASAIAQNYANSITNPRQQHLIVALGQMQERALLIRQLGIGGASAVDIRNRIASTVPDITSGNTELALQKLNAIDNLINFLSLGIPKVPVKRPGVSKQPIWEQPPQPKPIGPQPNMVTGEEILGGPGPGR